MQQSAERVHGAPFGSQFATQTRPSEALGAQTIEQHSSGVAHAVPTARHIDIATTLTQRSASPTRVGWQSARDGVVSEQQSRVADPSPATRQISPGEAQPVLGTQRPIPVEGSIAAHAPTAPPQQSASRRQSSPAGMHPPSDWQTWTPRASAAHVREQQSAPLPQSSPIGAQPATGAQLEAVQTPLQQSAATTHVPPLAAHGGAVSTAGAASRDAPPGSSSTSS